MEYLKEGYLGAIAAKLIVENKEEIVRMVQKGKEMEDIKDFLQDCPETQISLRNFMAAILIMLCRKL